jgi:hypothetical protein
VTAGAPWAGIDRTLLAIYVRWQTGANLRLFLNVSTEEQGRHTREDERHLWEPRRRFWLSLFAQSRPLEAWPAFSPEAEAAQVARQLVGRSDSRIEYGKQIGRSNNTSILLMRIAGARREWIVVEGSHSYKVHISDPSAGEAPKLFKDA